MCSCSLTCFFHSHLHLGFTFDISLLTPCRKHPSLYRCVCACVGGFPITKVSCAFCQRCQDLKRNTCKSHLCEIPLVQCDTCLVSAWAKPVGLQGRSFLCDSQSHILLPWQSLSPGGSGRCQLLMVWWEGRVVTFHLQTVILFLTLHASSHKACCVCPLNPFCLYFSREAISRVIIYKAVQILLAGFLWGESYPVPLLGITLQIHPHWFPSPHPKWIKG